MSTESGIPADDGPDFRALFEAAPGRYLVLDADLRIVAVTDAYTATTMSRREDLVGRRLFDVFAARPGDPGADAAARNLLASIEHVRAAGVPDSMPPHRYDLRGPQGAYEERWWNVRNAPVRAEDGTVTHVIHCVEDVTELVRREQTEGRSGPLMLATHEAAENARRLKEAHTELAQMFERSRALDELKSRFYANVSHELRTPLVLILGPAEELERRGDLGEEEREQVRLIERNARMLLQLVNDLLEASRLESGHVQLDYADVDLSALLEGVAAHFTAAVAATDATLTVLDGGPVMAQVDPDRIQRVVFNLIANAVRFTPRGGQMSCRARVDPERDVAVLEVADSGEGIAPEHRKAVFERFQQLEGTATRRAGGAGLGLSIARDVVVLHGGSITVGEAPDGGALFTVELPRRAPAGARVRDHQPPTSAQAAAGGTVALAPSPVTAVVRDERPLIAIVEDNPELNRFIADGLGDGYQVVSALDGREGLALVRATHPDVVLCDVMMPGLSGDQLIRAIRADRDLDVMPILVLTARAEEDLRLLLLRAGASEIMVKPFPIEELRARVANLVEARRARARQTALAVELAERNLALRQMADRDEVSGLMSRRRFGEELDRHAGLVERYGARGAVIMLDIEAPDGHDGPGDALVAEVGGALRGRLRATDAVARVDAHEFAVLLPAADAAEATRVAIALLREVRDRALPTGATDDGLHAGIAAFGAADATPAVDVLAAAGRALREARTGGPGRVMVAAG